MEVEHGQTMWLIPEDRSTIMKEMMGALPRTKGEK